MEAKTPGFGLFGITGIICLALRFGAGAVLGLTEWIDIVLIVVGLGLLALELFVIPGFGIAGVAGIVCLLVGIFLSMVPNEFAVPSNPFSTTLLLDAGRSMLFTFAAFTVLAAVAWKLFPHTPFGRALILGHSQQAAAGYAVQGAEEKDAAVGLTGVATSMLRPVGRGRFGAETYPVVARGEFIEPGSPIVIVQVDGNRYVVEKAREKA
jgi:membrane-bound serine protease (ClpP class)